MYKTHYISIVGNLMYVQVCMHSNIMYIVRMLCKYLNNLSMDHRKTTEQLIHNKALDTHISKV